MEDLFKRVGNEINIKLLSEEICRTYGLGEYKAHRLIHVGIDDLSYYLHTSKGKYLVKNINSKKTIENIGKWIKKNHIIQDNHIKAPKIISNNGIDIFISMQNDIYINSVVMECIDGKDLWSCHKMINKEEIDKIVQLTVSFHNIKEILNIEEYDEYCFMKIEEAYRKTKHLLSFKLKYEITKCIRKMKKVKFEKLSTCFIHGDLISTNIMKDKKGEIYLIDFFESGTGIRILDIVKILNSVIFHYKNPEESIELEKYFLEEYQKQMPLSDYEKQILNLLREADAYTGIMLEIYDSQEELENEENNSWLQNDLELIKRWKIESI